jgi:hypothetical protein
MPDENTIRHYRNRLTESGTLEALMQEFEQQLREAGYLDTRKNRDFGDAMIRFLVDGVSGSI